MSYENICGLVELVRLDLTNNVHDGAVTAFDNTNNAIAELNRIRLAYDAVSDIAQFFNGLEGQLNILHSLDQILTARVDCNTVIRDNNVNRLTGSGNSSNVGADRREYDPAAEER